jgi:hypothetical protein
MEAADSLETLISICHNKGYHIPEDWNLHIHCCENLKSPYKIMMFKSLHIVIEQITYCSVWRNPLRNLIQTVCIKTYPAAFNMKRGN